MFLYESPEVVRACIGSLQEQPYLRQGFRERELQLRELANYAEVIGSMLIAAVIGDVTGKEVNPGDVDRAKHIINLVGSLDDTSSNELLGRIFSTDFTRYIQIQKHIMQSMCNSYDLSVPREVTQEDIDQALAIDEVLLARGRAYLASEEAQTTIWQRIPEEKGGCPLRHAPKVGESDFDRFVLAQMEGYLENGRYLGPAQFILRTIQMTSPDTREYVIRHHGYETDWQLPPLAA